jgi:hypothetical protein
MGTRIHLSFSLLGRHGTNHAVFVLPRLALARSPSRPWVGTVFNTLLQFWAALLQPVDN